MFKSNSMQKDKKFTRKGAKLAKKGQITSFKTET